MFPLRFNTAAQVVPLGPFVSSTDGDTPETALTIANTDIVLLKAGATSEVSKHVGGATALAGGRYYATFDANDTDTLGPLRISVHVAGALYVWLDAVVFPDDVYDALFADTGAGVRSAPQSLPAVPANWLTGTAVDTTAVTKLQAGLLTQAHFDGVLPIGGIADEGTLNSAATAILAEIGTRQATFTTATSISFPAHFGVMQISSAGVVNINISELNGTTLLGDGSSGNKWRPG